MYYTHNSRQLSLLNFESIGIDFSDNPLIEMGKSIPWDAMIEKVQKLFAQEGRNSKSIRMMLGLELAKTFYQASDEEMIRKLKTDTALMCFCGFSSATEADIPDPSSMTKFRNRLTPEILHEISDLAVQVVIRKLPPRKRTQVTSDSTCLPANIQYPTDTKVLSQAADKLTKVILELREKGADVVVRGRRKTRKALSSFNKIRRKGKKQIRKMNKTLITLNRRLLRQIKRRHLELSCQAEEIVTVASTILAQQIQMYRKDSNRIPDRIVSFHEDKLRPIYRGKLKQATEFGKKVSIMVVGQKVVIPNLCEYENFTDTNLPQKDFDRFKTVTGNTPTEYTGDRGLHSPDNHTFLREQGVKDGIEYRGKIPKKANLPCKRTRRRLHRQRSPVEGKLGTLKTRYGCACIPYKSENTEVRFIMAAIMHNMRWYAG